jgi:hypothetical protein
MTPAPAANTSCARAHRVNTGESVPGPSTPSLGGATMGALVC